MAASYMALTYQRKSLICLASSRLSCVCALINRLDSGEKIMIFGERIAQADELYRLLHRQYPQRVGKIHSQMGTLANKNTLERFRAGDLRILISCKAMDEGAAGITGAANSTKILEQDMANITGKMDVNKEIVEELKKQMEVFVDL